MTPILTRVFRMHAAVCGFAAGVYGDRGGLSALVWMLAMSMIVHLCLRTIVDEWCE
jgi:hypothetical protein